MQGKAMNWFYKLAQPFTANIYWHDASWASAAPLSGMLSCYVFLSELGVTIEGKMPNNVCSKQTNKTKRITFFMYNH